jgi:radical SAM protein (TIGR01212 family)
MISRYNSYSAWLRRGFGGRVHKVSVDGGFTCPNRDGVIATGGCSYCNNDSFRASGVTARLSIEDQVRRGIQFLERRFDADRFIVYWQHYTNTYADVERLAELFSRSLRVDSRIVGLAIGTRADCVEDAKLDMLRELSRRHYVCLEYGLESIYDPTLARLNRGHDLACFEDAVFRTKLRGLPVCAHVILGFPWETRSQMLAYAGELNRLRVEFVKVHHLQVVRETALGREYEAKSFPTFTCEEWTALVCDFLERLSPEIVVQRLFGWAPEQGVLAPRWNRSKAAILRGIHDELERRGSRQGLALLARTDDNPK